MNTISEALLPTKPLLPYSPRCARNKGSPWPDREPLTQPVPGSALRILRFLLRPHQLLCLNFSLCMCMVVRQRSRRKESCQQAKL